MNEFNKISEDLFNKIRGRFPEVTLGDEEGNITNEPSDARFFDFKYKDNGRSLGHVSLSLSDEDGLAVIFSKDFVADESNTVQTAWYQFLRELRVFSKKRMLNFSIRDINKTNLSKRDYKFLANRKAGEPNMTESKLYGTSQVSYQNIDNARLVIKHTESINQENTASRTRKVKSMYIESADGERFKYPYKHLSGARAMARHVSEGGKPYDDFGKHITGLSEELSKLRKFKTYMGRSSVMAESLEGYMDVVKERIQTVKKRVEHLQKPNYYKEAFESFEAPVLEEVPDDVSENWIDQLTIKQFNEELKDVFPYIYNLVSEATRVKTLRPDSLYDELGIDEWSEDEKDTMALLNSYIERSASGDRIAGAKFEDYIDNNYPNLDSEKLRAALEQKDDTGRYDALRKLVRSPSHVEKDDTIDVKMTPDGGIQKADSAEQQAPLSEFILSYYDRETGEFPKGETAILTMVEKDYGEQYIEPAKGFIASVNTLYDSYQARTNPQSFDTGNAASEIPVGEAPEDYGNMSKSTFKNKEMEKELGRGTAGRIMPKSQRSQNSKPELVGMYFYNVNPGQEEEAESYGIKKTKSGKWAMSIYTSSGKSTNYRKGLADKAFGTGKWWQPKSKTESQVGERAANHIPMMSAREAKQIVKLMKAMERPASPAMASSMKKDIAKLKSKYNMSMSELLKLAKQKSVTEQTVVENERYYEGDQVVLRPEYAEPDDPDAVYTLKNWDGKRGWVVDTDGRGWSVTADQIAYPEEDLDEDSPVDKFSLGMGDSRSKSELEAQIKNLDDATLLAWSKDAPAGKVGKFFSSAVKKVQDKLVADEIARRGLNEEQLDELSPETLRSYAKKAQDDNSKRRKDAEAKGERMWSDSPNNTKQLTPTNKKYNKRDKDVRKAYKKAAAQEKPVQRTAPSTFGNNRGYGQGRYTGD